MESIIVSVIVITYNQERTISRTLDSILMQQCHVPFEIVIGEDCSTDATLSICQQYAQNHPDIIHLIANQQNKGFIDNYFDCIIACRGKYIADCAGDDFWVSPLKLEKELNIMEQHPNVTLVHTDWACYRETSGKTYASPQKLFTAPITAGHEMLEAIVTQLEAPVIHLCTSLYRADIIKQALREDDSQFRNKEFGCEDLQIAFLMAQQGDIAYLPEVTLNYSQGSETVSCSADSRKQFRFTLRVSNLSYLLAKRNHLQGPVVSQYFSKRVFALGMHAFRAHDRQLLEETLQAEKKWQAPRLAKTSVLFFAMHYRCLWGLALLLRKGFVTMKRLSH